jgi:hypothetical protein
MTMHVMSLSTLVDCLCPMILSCIDLRPWHVKLEYITTSLMILFFVLSRRLLFLANSILSMKANQLSGEPLCLEFIYLLPRKTSLMILC